jgi:NADH:ubiquinone oxidoreductase subunit
LVSRQQAAENRAWINAHRGRVRLAVWTIGSANGIRAARFLEPARPHEAVSLKFFTCGAAGRSARNCGRGDSANWSARTSKATATTAPRAARRSDARFRAALGVYNGYAEASRVPPSWHGWLHHTVDVAPTEETYTPREWEKPHVPNMTGTPSAYRPSGSTLASGRRPKATGDYQAWTPGN